MNIFHEEDNIGGLASIEIAHTSKIQSFNPLVFKPGAYWQAVEFHPTSGLLKDEVNDSDHGTYYTYAGTFKIHKKTKDLEKHIDPFLGQCIIMRITDMNGYSLVIGGPEYPVQLFRSSESGSMPADMNHYAFSFSVNQPNRALFG